MSGRGRGFRRRGWGASTPASRKRKAVEPPTTELEPEHREELVEKETEDEWIDQGESPWTDTPLLQWVPPTILQLLFLN
jgi:hypothetical protein